MALLIGLCMAPSGSATSMWSICNLGAQLEDADSWVWWKEGRGEAVAGRRPRPSAVIPSDLNQHAADITTAVAKERTNYVSSRNSKINK